MVRTVRQADFSEPGGVTYYVPAKGHSIPLVVRALWALSNWIHGLGSRLGLAMGAFEARRVEVVPIGSAGDAQLVQRRTAIKSPTG